MLPNATDLLISQRMRDLIAELRGELDYIVMDTSPLLPVVSRARRPLLPLRFPPFTLHLHAAANAMTAPVEVASRTAFPLPVFLSSESSLDIAWGAAANESIPRG
jgi:hypothetical protein